jgi:CheY-like chemotaxis protein
VELQSRSGTACHVHLVASPVLDNRGQLTGLVCNCAERSGQTIRSEPVAAEIPPTLGARRIEDFAHELNNVMLPVIANAELTLEALPYDSPLRSRLRVIKVARRASDLVREQLALAPLPADVLSSLDPAAPNPLSPVFGNHAAAVAEVLSSTSCERHRTGPATLLIVEDENLVRESMVEFLSRSGYNVLSAGSAEEALETSKTHSEIDLVITDVVLAGRLATVYPEMKVLFVSGYSQSAVFHRDVPSLNRAFLQKPFSLPILAEKVGGVLEPPKNARAAAVAGL